jgi:hypothetical protein
MYKTEGAKKGSHSGGIERCDYLARKAAERRRLLTFHQLFIKIVQYPGASLVSMQH